MLRFRGELRPLRSKGVVAICQAACLVLLLGWMFTQAISQEVDPRFAVAEYVRDNVLGGQYGDRTIWISSRAVDSSHEARSLDKAEPVMKFPYEGWMVMIDDTPGANWGHNVRWLIVRVDLGAHTTPQIYTFPPRVFDNEGNKIPVTCLEGATGVPCETPDVGSTDLRSLDKAVHSAYLTLPNQETDCLYAVLISGGIDDDSNYDRYRTNLRSMYTILLAQGYPKSNIFVYYADGAPLDLDDADGDGIDTTGDDVTGSADETVIRTRLQDLCADLNPVVDQLFVYVTDHGSSDGSICLWDTAGDGLDVFEKYSHTEMADDTANCQVCRLIMLQDQCYSGAFLPLAVDGNHDNTTVYAAASDSETSYGREYLDCWEELDHSTTTLEDLHQDVVENCSLKSTPGKSEVDETNDQVLLSDCCANTPPSAAAGGPYTAECQGTETSLALDGTGSSDPDAADTLTYYWTSGCVGGYFDDNTSATPLLTVDTQPGCSVICSVSLTVTDFTGASDTNTATITISDTVPPAITCPADTSIECDASSDPGNTGYATATDLCDPTPAIDFSDGITPGMCSNAWTIKRTWKATDRCGNASSCVQTIEVVDLTAPSITCPADATIECDEPTGPSHNGSATATDNCDANPDVTHSDVEIPGACPQEKTITRTWTATDACGNRGSCEQTIQVVDTTPPVIRNVTASPNDLWPPNHKMVRVNVSAIATDNCDPSPECAISSVSSDEPVNGLGDGDTAPDWGISGPLTVNLRAERSGKGDGRVYTVTVTCTDSCGNSSYGTTAVRVRHNR